MKHLITESQRKKIEELTTMGTWGKTDVDDKLFNAIYYKIGNLTILSNLIREFFIKIMGKDVSKIGDFDLVSFFESGGRSSRGLPRYFKKPDTFSALNYFLSQKVFKLIKGNYELDYIAIKDLDSINYYFFDSELELSIGYMGITKFENYYRSKIYKLLPAKTYKVGLSMIDDILIGRGYGKKMYLTVIDTVKCLVSDSLLYKGSLNMWANVIPKNVPYSGYITNDEKIVKLPTNNKLNYDNIDFFFASNSVDIFSKYIKSI